MLPIIKVVGTHALIVGTAAAAATVARDLFILILKSEDAS